MYPADLVIRRSLVTFIRAFFVVMGMLSGL